MNDIRTNLDTNEINDERSVTINYRAMEIEADAEAPRQNIIAF